MQSFNYAIFVGMNLTQEYGKQKQSTIFYGCHRIEDGDRSLFHLKTSSNTRLAAEGAEEGPDVEFLQELTNHKIN